MSSQIPVTAPAPYPPIKVGGPNICAARKIGRGIACAKSELSAVTAYQYQHWVLAGRQPGLAETIFRIARVEMHHLDILGSLVADLGGDPRYCCDRHGGCLCWNSGMLNYTRDVRELLVNNIADEKKAAEFYRETACEMTDPLVSAVLNRLALDELVHVGVFTRYLQELCGG